MAFLDFLKPKGGNGRKPPADQRADIDTALAKIAVDRTSAQLVLGGLDRRREDLLLADAPASEIVKLDAEGDHARIKLEKLDVFEAEVHARLSELQGIEDEVEWRRLFDARHAAACEFASSFNETCGAMFELRPRPTRRRRARSGESLASFVSPRRSFCPANRCKNFFAKPR
jgi:hypothetical protein